MAESSGSNRAGPLLLVAVLLTLLLADWFFGSFTRDLLRGNAQLTVTSEPPGARVLVDTLELGVTPLGDVKVPPGDYTLRVEHRYSQPHREPISVARGERLQRSVVLVSAVGALSLVSNPRGAAIVIDGQAYSEVTPATIKALSAGVHEVQLTLPKRRVIKEQVEVLPEQTARLAVDIERLPMGALQFVTSPENARVELFVVINDEPAATALDYVEGMQVPAQTYLARVSHSGYEPQEQRFVVRRGKNSLAIDLQQITATLGVSVAPENAQVRVSAAGKTFTYEQPVELGVGRLTLRAKRQGYRTETKHLTLDSAGASVVFNLKKYNVSVGRVFRDSLKSGGEGPQLVVLGAGAFRMGDLTGNGAAEARPAHKVQLEQPFAMGVFEVSNAEWLKREGEAGDTKPVVNVSREQVSSYLSWLSGESGALYRLPSEAEWEYAARAGSTQVYATTDSPQELCGWANVGDKALTQRYDRWQALTCDDGAVRLAAVGSYAGNAFGLYDMLGNASEMQADCWHPSYNNAPGNGAVWGGKCSVWVARGGAWDSTGDVLRVSHRERVFEKGGELGFRVVREL